MNRTCTYCSQSKPEEDFAKTKYGFKCKLCKNTIQKEGRLKNNNSSTLVYEKTKKGFLVRLYRNMKSRVEGVQKEKYHLYEGKELLDKEVFYEWAMNSPEFHILFAEYELNGYERKLAPSVDRIDSEFGYHLDNMEWVTMSVNSQRGALSKARKEK